VDQAAASCQQELADLRRHAVSGTAGSLGPLRMSCLRVLPNLTLSKLAITDDHNVLGS